MVPNAQLDKKSLSFNENQTRELVVYIFKGEVPPIYVYAANQAIIPAIELIEYLDEAVQQAVLLVRNPNYQPEGENSPVALLEVAEDMVRNPHISHDQITIMLNSTRDQILNLRNLLNVVKDCVHEAAPILSKMKLPPKTVTALRNIQANFADILERISSRELMDKLDRLEDILNIVV